MHNLNTKFKMWCKVYKLHEVDSYSKLTQINNNDKTEKMKQIGNFINSYYKI